MPELQFSMVKSFSVWLWVACGLVELITMLMFDFTSISLSHQPSLCSSYDIIAGPSNYAYAYVSHYGVGSCTSHDDGLQCKAKSSAFAGG
eukprot:scaffold33146_cov63-Cyclotella_meneghiniana.AAC.2